MTTIKPNYNNGEDNYDVGDKEEEVCMCVCGEGGGISEEV